MSHENGSIWSESAFSNEYLEKADVYIIERKRLFSVLKSFYARFVKEGKNHILDLGCGDGVITSELLEVDKNLSATLVDLSDEMLERAKKRHEGNKSVVFFKAGLKEISEGTVLQDKFTFAVSSLAIHHLDKKDKQALYSVVYRILERNGCFVNIDCVRAGTEALEGWYMGLWREWIDEKKLASGLKEDYFGDVIRRYGDFENKPDTLEDQLDMLRRAGFTDVECYYKYGIFAVFGGRKC